VKVILDTNVFISGVFFSGPPSKILVAWKNKTISLVISPSIYEEYRRVAGELSKQFAPVDISSILELIAINADMVPDITLPTPVCTDPDDDKFLACAVAAKAMIICSGDKALLKTSGYRNIQILTPADFCKNHMKES